jgi:pyrimidine-nucleoside phosphorylase/thymidine phosphorylase
MTSPATDSTQQIRMLDVIARKRDGLELSSAEIAYVVQGYTSGEIPDYQASAWLMASLLRGLTRGETATLTEAMLRSGSVLDLSALPGRKIDKHSTGGVGDKTSLVLAPVAAAGGLVVPMISGRGLGHTGGTLDKLESIPGFSVKLSLERFQEVLRACRCAMIGQTDEIAPADRKFYALRDVTGTVESPNLICASIMSKKLAEGLDGLVLDVKTGSGAFMKTEADASQLAQLMVETGTRMGKRVVALITDMDQPLGLKVGNALEVEECTDVLRGQGPPDLRELCLQLAAWMFVLGDKVRDPAKGKELAAKLIDTGQALEIFRRMIELQGGDAGVLDDYKKLPRARHQLAVKAREKGYVTAIQCEQMGKASVILGGGREKKEDSVDPAVGIELHKKVGDAVAADEAVCTVYYNSEARAAQAQKLIESSYQIRNAQPTAQRPLIHKIIAPEGRN